MSLRSRPGLLKAASAAVACAVSLATATVPLQAQAAQTSASHVISNIVGPHGELVRFTMFADGSVGVDASVSPAAAQHSTLGRVKYATPLELFRAVAPQRQIPAELLGANDSFVKSLEAMPLERAKPVLKTERGMSHRIVPMNSQQWFINQFCNVAASYSACYAPAYSWAYLYSSSVYYGFAAAYAVDAPLYFNVSPIGSWTVPTGYYRYAWKYNSFHPFGLNEFGFLAQVQNAQTFDFEANVDY